MKYGSIVAVLSLCSFAAADEARHPGYCDLSTATCWHPQTPLTAEEVARYADRACHSLHPVGAPDDVASNHHHHHHH
ncbi:hypothetical protein JDV02_000095 [Purpureocillium takamizusanense]|uniref:Uncharacterized protein n=1 Tax=Purpureocillium takamizusanense TaxID=2060973 RepID=A0A9Q8Q432_9HYPO|nr:uncharacterized protein JDV02_000095 [Purpureocillium takamizusanense]UNI13344.1 hypothetical protein JDV02_000095 [Purpureocillium takamizusanense]